MNGIKKVWMLIAIISGLISNPVLSCAMNGNSAEPSRKAGEIVIKVRPSDPSHNAQFVSSVLNNVNGSVGVKSMQPVFRTAPRTSGLNQAVQSAVNLPAQDGLSRWFTVSLDAGQDVDQAVKAYQQSGLVEYAEPVYVYSIASTPNDPYFSTDSSWGQSYADQWGLKDIQCEKAWNVSRGDNSVIVAVIDTGVDYTHPDLAANIWNNPAEIANNGIDDNGDGYVDDIRGWNFIDNNNDVSDPNGHGSHVSGIIAAVGNNGQGISGVCWQAKIMAIKALTSSGAGSSTDLSAAIKYAADNGARVINISWGGYGNSSVIQDALDYAYAHNCVIVAAAGNNNTDAGRFFPGNYGPAITVAACDANDHKASFSNYGTVVDVTAPGVDILSLRAKGTDMGHNEANIVGNDYYRSSGTSMATPFVSGLAALVLSVHPEFSNADVEQAIISSCDHLGAEGKNDDYGYGRINASRTLTLNTTEQIKVADFTACDTPSDDGHSVSVSWPLNASAPVKGYNVYYSEHPFASITDDGVQVYIASPSNDPQANGCQVTGLKEGTGYYFAVIATMNPVQGQAVRASSSVSGFLSSTKPVYPVHNIIRSGNGSDTISYGFDRSISAIVQADQANENKALNIILPEKNKESVAGIADTKISAQIRASSDEELSANTVEYKSDSQLNGLVTIQLSYPNDITGWKESNLRIYTLNEDSANWEEVAGDQLIHREGKIVSVSVAGSELMTGKVYRLFALAGTLDTLDEVKVFPNPYKPNSGLGHTKITFTNLIAESTVKIYSLTGELVRTLNDDGGLGQINWDAANDDGQKVASGLYIFLVTSADGKHKSGKLAIIK